MQETVLVRSNIEDRDYDVWDVVFLWDWIKILSDVGCIVYFISCNSGENSRYAESLNPYFDSTLSMSAEKILKFAPLCTVKYDDKKA